MKAWQWREAEQAKTPIWQLTTFPAEPVSWREPPQEAHPCFRNWFHQSQNGLRISHILQRISAQEVAQGLGVPRDTPKERLLTPGFFVIGGFRTHPAGLASLIAQQPIKQLSGLRTHTFLSEQPLDPPLSHHEATKLRDQAPPPQPIQTSIASSIP